MNKYDLVIQLGSQVRYNDKYLLPLHTRIRTEAAALVLKTGIARRLIISGGSNFGVRYNDTKIIHPPVFTFEAFAKADLARKSEAAVIKSVLINEYGVPAHRIFAETVSSTTEENAEFVKILLRRRPMFTGNEKVAILTQLYHMEEAWPVFLRAGLDVTPLCAENVLATHHERRQQWIRDICKYYETPRGNKQYPVEEIQNLLNADQSLATLIH